MPYDPSNPPDKVRGLPPKKQRQWVHIFNSCYAKHGDEVKCHKMAWGVTGGWKEDKGFDPLDPDRDLEVEREVRALLKAEEVLEMVVKNLDND